MHTLNWTRRDLIAGGAALALTGPAHAGLSAADGRPLNFLVVGDWGRDGKAFQRHVAARMAHEASQIDSRFVVSTGDNFYNLGVSSVADRQWDTSFECIYTHGSLQTAWYPVLGNHDYGGNIGAQIKRTRPGGRWQMPDRWHKISFGGPSEPRVDLFFIDTVVWGGKESFPYSFLGSSLDREDRVTQKRWLTEELRRSDPSTVKLVFGHHPIYSVGKHGGKANFDDLDRLLRRAGVTAYVNGHDHCLYHIHSSKMDYICSGGGSQELAAFTGDRTVYGCVFPRFCPADTNDADKPTWLSFVDRAGFASFSVTDTQVRFKLIDRSGAVFHDHVLPKRSPDSSVAVDDPRDPVRPIDIDAEPPPA